MIYEDHSHKFDDTHSFIFSRSSLLVLVSTALLQLIPTINNQVRYNPAKKVHASRK